MYLAFAPVVVVAGAATLVFADRRLKAAAQPLRLQLAEKGEDFLRLPHAPEEARSHVRFLLDRAFSMRGSLLLAVLMVPFVALVFVFYPKPMLHFTMRMNQMEPITRSAFFEVCRIHDSIMLANHWLLLPLVELEIILFMPLAIVLRAVSFQVVCPKPVAGIPSSRISRRSRHILALGIRMPLSVSGEIDARCRALRRAQAESPLMRAWQFGKSADRS